jgi:hypothetical protein
VFDESTILKRSLENVYALPNIDELLSNCSNSDRCLLSAANSLFTQLLCLADLQWNELLDNLVKEASVEDGLIVYGRTPRDTIITPE